MRIAVVQSFYGMAVPGGENIVCVDQVDTLRRAGHEVHLVSVGTDDFKDQPLYALRCAAQVATGRGRTPLARLRELAPDVVHVHNLFPNYGRTWVADWPGPLVTTLHNYRPLCANALLYREGSACTRCLDGDRWAGLKNGCYRESRLATLPLAWSGRGGPLADPLLRRADRIVVLSELSQTLYERAGVPEQRLQLIPNYVRDEAPATGDRPARGWLYIGKLSVEKGILDLLTRWPAGIPLDIVGTGPLEAECRAAAPASVRFVGTVPRAEVQQLMGGYAGLVFPSRCFENAPLVYCEALAASLPVLAFDGSAVAVAVRGEGTGRRGDLGGAARAGAAGGRAGLPRAQGPLPCGVRGCLQRAGLAGPDRASVRRSTGWGRGLGVRRTGPGTRRVTLVLPYLTPYRLPFLRLLRTELAAGDVELTIAHGSPTGPSAARQAEPRLPGAVPLRQHAVQLAGRELLWHRLGDLARRSDALVLPQSLHHLRLYPLLATRPARIGLWGHGRTHVSAHGRAEQRAKAALTRRAGWFFAYTDAGADYAEAAGLSRERITVVRNSIDTGALVAAHAAVTGARDRRTPGQARPVARPDGALHRRARRAQAHPLPPRRGRPRRRARARLPAARRG